MVAVASLLFFVIIPQQSFCQFIVVWSLTMEMGKGLIFAMGLWTISNYSSFGSGLTLRNPLILLALDKGNARPSKRHPTSP